MFRLLLLVYISLSTSIDVQYSDKSSYPWFILLPCIWQVFYSHFIIFASKGWIVEHLSTCRGRNNMYHKEEFFERTLCIDQLTTYIFPFSLSSTHLDFYISFASSFLCIIFFFSLSLSLSLSRERERRKLISLIEEDLVGEYIVVLG